MNVIVTNRRQCNNHNPADSWSYTDTNSKLQPRSNDVFAPYKKLYVDSPQSRPNKCLSVFTLISLHFFTLAFLDINLLLSYLKVVYF